MPSKVRRSSTGGDWGPDFVTSIPNAMPYKSALVRLIRTVKAGVSVYC